MKHSWFCPIGLAIFLGLGACILQDAPTQVPVDPPTQAISTSPTATNQTIPSAATTATLTQSTLAASATATATFTLTPEPLTCWNEAGRIESQQINTQSLPDPLVFRVYLPPCYDLQVEREYPVLYLLHGQSYNDDQWDRLGVDETADQLISAGIISPFIIIMPGDRDQYTPPPQNLFGETLVYELIPHIDQTYRTIDQRAYRAIGGISRGGNWAIHLGLSHWEIFGAIAGHSTPTFATDGPPRIREYLQAIPDDKLPRIYLDAGADDSWISYTYQLEAILTEGNIPHEWYLFQGTHDEEYWANHIEDYLRWYTLDW